MDSTIRQRQRRGEVTALDLARAGWVSRERLELAAQVRASDWAWDDRKRLICEAAELLGETLPARLAADYAARLTQSEEGTAAIAAARAWAEEPTEARRRVAGEAAAVARAAWAADYAADYAAVAASRAAASAAWAAAVASAAAARSAAVASAAAAADAAYSASRAAASAAHVAYADEHRWQRERLAIYLGSQGWPAPVAVTRG